MDSTTANRYTELLLSCVTHEAIRDATRDTLGGFPLRGGVNFDCEHNFQPYVPQFELPTFETWTALYNQTMGAGTVGSQEMKSIYDIINFIVDPPLWTFEFRCLDAPNLNTARLIRWEFFRMLQSQIPGEQFDFHFDGHGPVPFVRPGSLTSKALRVYVAYCDEIVSNSLTSRPRVTFSTAQNYHKEFVAIKSWFENASLLWSAEDIRTRDFDLLFKRERRVFSSTERRDENDKLARVVWCPRVDHFCYRGPLDEPSPSFRRNLCSSRLIYRKMFPTCFSRGLRGGWCINRDVQALLKRGATYFPHFTRDYSQYREEYVEKQLEAYYCWLSYNTRWSENLTENTWIAHAVGDDDFDAAQEGPSCAWYLKMGMIREENLLPQFSKHHKKSRKTGMEIEAMRFLNAKQLENERSLVPGTPAFNLDDFE